MFINLRCSAAVEQLKSSMSLNELNKTVKIFIPVLKSDHTIKRADFFLRFKDHYLF